MELDAAPGLTASFEAFRGEIDAFNDQRERLIKVARDVTALSKKLIFHLHRYVLEGDNTALLQGAHTKLEEIVALLFTTSEKEGLASEGDIPNSTMQRCERFLGPALEEWIEAVSFLHYLEHGTLVSYDEVQRMLMRGGHMVVHVTRLRYVLGLSDLTGELMRFAINAVASSSPLDVMERVGRLQHTIYQYVRKKQQVTWTSLRKVEDGTSTPHTAAYTLRVRSAEYATNVPMMQEMVRRALMSGSEEA